MYEEGVSRVKSVHMKRLLPHLLTACLMGGAWAPWGGAAGAQNLPGVDDYAQAVVTLTAALK